MNYDELLQALQAMQQSPTALTVANPLQQNYSAFNDISGSTQAPISDSLVNWQSLPGYEQFYSPQNYSQDGPGGDIDRQALEAYLAQQGMQIRSQMDPATQQSFSWVEGPDGQPIPESIMNVGTDDSRFWKGAMLAAAVTGANVMGAGSVGMTGADAAMGAGAPELANGAFLGEGVASGVPASFGGALDFAAPAAAGAAAPAASSSLAFTEPAAAVGAAGANSLIPGVNNGQLFSGGLSLLGAAIGSNSAGNAVDAQVGAADKANELQRYMYDQGRTDLTPWREAGTSALGQLQALMQNPNSITSDPGYEFQRKEGERALRNQANSVGRSYSGAQAQALSRYNNDYATTKFNESYNRLAGIAGTGQQAVNSGNALGANYANQAGQNITGAGNAQGSGYVAKGNLWNNALGQIGNNMQQDDMYSKYGYRPRGW